MQYPSTASDTFLLQGHALPSYARRVFVIIIVGWYLFPACMLHVYAQFLLTCICVWQYVLWVGGCQPQPHQQQQQQLLTTDPRRPLRKTTQTLQHTP
jgi:hypothetical protein